MFTVRTTVQQTLYEQVCTHDHVYSVVDHTELQLHTHEHIPWVLRVLIYMQAAAAQVDVKD